MTQKHRTTAERRDLWLYYTRLRAAYVKAGAMRQARRVSSWRAHLHYEPRVGDLARLKVTA